MVSVAVGGSLVASSVVVLVSIFVAASFNDGVVVIALITSLFTDVVTVLTSEKSFFLEIACGGDFANTTDFVVSRVIVVGIAGEAEIVLVFVVVVLVLVMVSALLFQVLLKEICLLVSLVPVL